MLMAKAQRSAIRTLRGWAISVLQEAGAIRECEFHGWIEDRADPYARQHAVAVMERGQAPAVPDDPGRSRRRGRGRGTAGEYETDRGEQNETTHTSRTS